MALNLEKIGAKLWDTAKEIFARTAYKEAAGIPGLQQEIAKAKVKAGKDVLWSAFPVILIGVLAFIVIRKF